MQQLKQLVLLALTLSLTEGVMVCYFGSWSVYRAGDGKFDVEDIDPTICSHIIFGFAGLNTDNTIKVLDPWNELCDNYGKCAFDRFTALKQKNANLKALLAVGGWNEGSAKYSAMASTAASRQTFIDSSITLLKAHNFDGLDMDWEYPTQRGGNPEDKANFVVLMRELKDALHAEGMMVSAAVSAGKETIDAAYDIPNLANELDLMNLMSYDLHGAWEVTTHFHSQLYQYPTDVDANAYLNQDFAVNYWINGGMPAEKIALGVPLYGRCWSLDSEANTGVNAPAANPAPGGSYTQSPGFLGFNEMCEDHMNSPSWIVVHDTNAAGNEPYAYDIPRSRTWCSYDDAGSAAIKAAYAKTMGLAGLMVWSVDTEDFLGKCGRSNDIIKTLVETFYDTDITTPPTLPPPTTDPSATTTTEPPTPPPTGVCQQPGLNADPNDCTHYYSCTYDGSGGYIATPQDCSPGTLFNPNSLVCDWDYSVCAIDGACPNDCP